MIQQGVIELASSEWASTVLIVPRSDRDWRVCINFWKPKLITVKDTYPVPRMDEVFDSLGDAKLFTTVD